VIIQMWHCHYAIFLRIIGAVAVGVWFAFGVIERLNQLETRNKLLKKIY
jgi:hypothetical protein